MKLIKGYISAALIILFISTTKTGAQPLLPSGFNGSLTINGKPAPVGAVVSAWINGIHYPTDFTVNTEGIYGVLYVAGDDPSTPDVKEGGAPRDIIDFRVQVNEFTLFAMPNGVWQGNGVNQKLDLSAEGQVPVELISFDHTLKDNSVELHWSTATETNNLGFEIQRSSDRIAFSTIGFIQGHGTSVSPHIYHFTDPDLFPGKYSYRLKQLDIDGAFTYSQIHDINIMPLSKFELHQNYPNPFNALTQIRYYLPKAGYVSIEIYDMNGQLVRNLVCEYKSTGFYTVCWNSKNNYGKLVANGVYLYCFYTGTLTMTKKMILLR